MTQLSEDRLDRIERLGHILQKIAEQQARNAEQQNRFAEQQARYAELQARNAGRTDKRIDNTR